MQVYAAYAPYQFLAYWHELWLDYEARFGSFASMNPEDYVLMTGWSVGLLVACCFSICPSPAF